MLSATIGQPRKRPKEPKKAVGIKDHDVLSCKYGHLRLFPGSSRRVPIVPGSSGHEHGTDGSPLLTCGGGNAPRVPSAGSFCVVSSQGRELLAGALKHRLPAGMESERSESTSQAPRAETQRVATHKLNRLARRGTKVFNREAILRLSCRDFRVRSS